MNKIAHKWKIKNFGYFFYEDVDLPRLSFIQSDDFGFNGQPNGKHQFFLRLKPKEVFTPMTLHLRGEVEGNISFTYKLALLKWYECENNSFTSIDETKLEEFKSKHDEFLEGSAQLNQDTENVLDFPTFIDFELVMNRKKGYLPDDALTVYCEITRGDMPFQQASKVIPTESECNAKVSINQLQHHWSIYEFSTILRQKSICLSSKDFFYENEGGHKFFLRLWPKGRDSESEHLSIYLYLLTSVKENHPQMVAHYQISLINAREQMCHTILNKEHITSGNEFGTLKYIRCSNLLNMASELLPEGNLKIYCKLDLIGKEVCIQKQIDDETSRLNSTHISHLTVAANSTFLMNVNSRNNMGNMQ